MARHSTPLLTFGAYSHAETEKLAHWIAQAFPNPLPAASSSTKGGSDEAQAHRAAQ